MLAAKTLDNQRHIGVYKEEAKALSNQFSVKSEVGKTLFKTYSNKLTRVKKLSKKLYYYSEIAKRKTNPKKLWKFVNAVLPKNNSKNNSISKLTVDDE